MFASEPTFQSRGKWKFADFGRFISEFALLRKIKFRANGNAAAFPFGPNLCLLDSGSESLNPWCCGRV